MSASELDLTTIKLRLEQQEKRLLQARRELILQCQTKLKDDYAIDEAAAKLTSLSISVRQMRGEIERRGVVE